MASLGILLTVVAVALFCYSLRRPAYSPVPPIQPSFDVKIEMPSASLVSSFSDAPTISEPVRVKRKQVLMVSGKVLGLSKDTSLPPFAIVEVRKSPWSENHPISSSAIAVYPQPTETREYSLILKSPAESGTYTLCVLWGDSSRFVSVAFLEVIK